MTSQHLDTWGKKQWLREQPDQQKLVIDAYYDDPLSKAADRYWRSDEWEAIRRSIFLISGAAPSISAQDEVSRAMLWPRKASMSLPLSPLANP